LGKAGGNHRQTRKEKIQESGRKGAPISKYARKHPHRSGPRLEQVVQTMAPTPIVGAKVYEGRVMSLKGNGYAFIYRAGDSNSRLDNILLPFTLLDESQRRMLKVGSMVSCEFEIDGKGAHATKVLSVSQ
jgi:hypothetical protein